MNNPWVNFSIDSRAPYVLNDDFQCVNEFNKNLRSEEHNEFKLIADQVPEPWLGPVESAMLVVLQLNPRYEVNSGPPNLEKLRHIGKLDSPHYELNKLDDMKMINWWQQCFKQVATMVGSRLVPNANYIEQLKAGYEHLATRICSIEFLPYGSQNYGRAILNLPSRAFSLELVRKALRRGARILVLKGERQWKNAVQELNGYSYLTIARGGYRAPKHVTPYTCGHHFCKIVGSVFPDSTDNIPLAPFPRARKRVATTT